MNEAHVLLWDEDESYYPHYLRETILVYQGCDLVAEVIKDDGGETIETKWIQQHHHHHHQYHHHVSNPISDQEKGENLLDQQVTKFPLEHHPALKTNFIFSSETQTIIRKGKRTRRANIIDKNPINLDLPNQENLGFLVNQPPVLMVNNINNEGEGAAVLFVEKELTKTDDSDGHQRFSISRKKVMNDRFLTKEELAVMKNKGAVNAVLTDPCGRKYDVRLMIEVTGNKCECYKIPKPWNLIRHNNNIHQGALIQLWASRPNGSHLCFHLVRTN